MAKAQRRAAAEAGQPDAGKGRKGLVAAIGEDRAASLAQAAASGKAMPASLLARTAQAADERDPDVRRIRNFFNMYDVMAFPPLFEHDASVSEREKGWRTAAILAMQQLLMYRVAARAAFALLALGRPAEGLPLSDAPAILKLSAMQLGCYRAHLMGKRGIDLPLARKAFEMFANGELRIPTTRAWQWNCEPDGAPFLCFAEFAFMAIEAGVDAEEWSQLLPGLVAVQPIWARCYRSTLPPPAYATDYTYTNFSPDKQADAAFKALCRKECDGRSVEELAALAGRNAHAAFPGGLRRTT
jgi:hypothetical protein